VTEVEVLNVESVVAVLLLEDCAEDTGESVVEVELSFEEVLMVELLELAMLDVLLLVMILLTDGAVPFLM